MKEEIRLDSIEEAIEEIKAGKVVIVRGLEKNISIEQSLVLNACSYI